MNKGPASFLIWLSIAVCGLSAVLYFHHPSVQPIVVNHIVKPVIAKPAVIQITPLAASITVDPRLIALQKFLNAHHCLDANLAQTYLDAADAHALDWRLLPAMSFKEEQCTRNAYMNNLWGWASGAKKFDSLTAGIDFIAGQLDMGRAYYGKTLDQKIRTYNSHPEYLPSLKSIMAKISS